MNAEEIAKDVLKAYGLINELPQGPGWLSRLFLARGLLDAIDAIEEIQKFVPEAQLICREALAKIREDK